MGDGFNDDPLTTSPVYDGLIFRSTGNYGSTVHDPVPGGKEEILQIIICDDCVKRGAVTRIFDIRKNITSKSELLLINGVDDI